MSISTPFIRRPVGTWLLTVAVCLAGTLGYNLLPVSPLPQVEFPTISVGANLPGASPETMASSVSTPLERSFARIAGITEMTSNSSLGSTNITMQFDLSRDIDSCARDVQAAIAAARGQLPSNLPNNPNYRKVNPSDAPVMIIAITSDTYDKPAMYDVASTILQQKLAQMQGVGQVFVGGSSLPSVRVEVNPTLLNNLGLTLADVRTALGNANVNRPKGDLEGTKVTASVTATDQLLKAGEYEKLIIHYANSGPGAGAAVRLKDVASVSDSVEDVRNFGISDGKPAILMIIFRQPGANIIETVDHIKAVIPELRADVPAGMNLDVVLDRTGTIRASVNDVKRTLLLSIALVVGVVFFFLRDVRATLIPSVAVPISLIGTFGIMYLLGYSLDNLSLMAMTIATGFVVDDAIVVVENVSRHLEEGMSPVDAALTGAKEIGFTVFSISVSLVAVFIPLLLMGGIIGRLFREFAVTLSVAIMVSMVVSLTTTPMMCATLLRHRDPAGRGRLYRLSEKGFEAVLGFYEWSLGHVLRHRFITLIILLATVVTSVYLYIAVPKGFFPQQDTGRLNGSILADQSTSFRSMAGIVEQFSQIIRADPDVDNVIAFAGGGGNANNTGRLFANLKPLGIRKITADKVIERLRPKLAQVAGASMFLQSVQDLRMSGRQSNSQYQYTLQGDTVQELLEWAPKLQARMLTLPGVLDVNSDLQVKGLQAGITIDRDAAGRLGVEIADIDNALYDAFGQRQVSTMYRSLNQYHVVMEAQDSFTNSPDGLQFIRVHGKNNTMVPLFALTKYEPSATSLAVNHQGQFPSITLSFNLREGTAMSQALPAIQQATAEIGMPPTIRASFSGTGQAYQDSLSTQPLLIAAALAAVYIVLGTLYESLVHPVTILSTLPSAGVGALLALWICQVDLSVIALIGIILLIGIVKKNAIMMIDFALVEERDHGKSPEEAIFRACVLRFRPIMMTTMAALLGGIPLAFGAGTGSELRRPLGVAIVGGLIFSQMLTLYTTPVVYILLDRLRLRWKSLRTNLSGRPREGAILPEIK